MTIYPIVCPYCRSFNPRAAVRCLDCMRDLRRHAPAIAQDVYAPRGRTTSTRLDRSSSLPPVYFTSRTLAKLESLARLELADSDPVRSFLLRELDRGVILAPGRMSSDVVEVGDRIVYRTSKTRRPENRQLAYPAGPGPAGDVVSVLSPVGVALLGLREGSGMSFAMPDGTTAGVHVVKVAPQPVEQP